ncbi:hypothetical protein FQN49_001762 [Arthroderma sp. PD_2]|nr:hypothetical protein FQN49_001762 [Arthroderma sp. PD_2]
MAADGKPVPGSLYVYAPNQIAPIVFTVAYGLSAIGHFYQCFRYKSWRLLGLHPVCALTFTVGYGLRIYGSHNYIYNDNTMILIIFILSQVFIFVCPPLLELANYHVLGRVLYYMPYFAPLPPAKVLKIFGGLMMLVESLNAVGVALSANPSSTEAKQTLGSNLTIAALAIQLAVIVIFIVIAGIFHWRCSKANIRSKSIVTPLITLYVSMVLILARCIYRLIEHFGNTAVHLEDPESLKSLSPILRYEYYFFIFESTLMFINSVIWNIWNPARLLPQNHRIHLTKDGRAEITEEEEKDTRPLLARAGHVVTCGMFFGDKKRKQHPYELNEYQPVSSPSP